MNDSLWPTTKNFTEFIKGSFRIKICDQTIKLLEKFSHLIFDTNPISSNLKDSSNSNNNLNLILENKFISRKICNEKLETRWTTAASSIYD